MRLISLLQDAPCSGTPAQFSPEQLTQIIAVACSEPQACGRPISHWSAGEIADEVVKRTIVPQISERTVNRLLAEMDLKPHRSRYWQELGSRMSTDIPGRSDAPASQLYEQAPSLLAQGKHLVSVDEKTGIQACERLYPTQLATPGRLERREVEYERHGTCWRDCVVGGSSGSGDCADDWSNSQRIRILPNILRQSLPQIHKQAGALLWTNLIPINQKPWYVWLPVTVT